jgi:hypothetical protein
VLDWMPVYNAQCSALNVGPSPFRLRRACALGGLCGITAARGDEKPIDVMVAACSFAFPATFIIRMVFSYQRHIN